MMMASSSITTKEAEAESTMPNCLELPIDITANILSRLDTIDIVKSVCLVCPLWWNFFKDPLKWHSIHMTNFTSLSSITFSELAKICCYAVERSRGHLLDIEIRSFGNDDVLQSIAQNGSSLRRLWIVSCLRITDKAFCEALRKLPLLEELNISPCHISKNFLEVIGISCPLLKSLKFDRRWCLIHRCPYDHEAFIISETMSRLCHLDIKGNGLTAVGLVAILDKCPLLEYLDIRDCYSLSLTLSESLKKRCIEQIKDLQLPVMNNYEDFDYLDFDNDFYDPYD
ncbi:unnamed protein product [Trifolium pratense]|uniref:Uncharacterized protein n=1 Tax=Trifolium pratense TaxID=57577 RepID=A0ACB0J6V7_TRIPR|nr:unnamed protein product [Trifolium pratense]